jgi:hypothetical protein
MLDSADDNMVCEHKTTCSFIFSLAPVLHAAIMVTTSFVFALHKSVT